MSLTQRLTEYISACFTGLWIESHEHEDALREIAQMCRQQNWRLATWDVSSGLRLPGQGNGQAADAGGTDPLAAIRSLNALASPDSSALIVLSNFHRFLASAEIVQTLAQQITAGKVNRTFVLILSPVVQIPTELEKLFVVVEHDLPSRQQIEEIARGIATESGELPEGDGLQTVLDAAAGLTRYECEGAFSLSLVRHSAIRPEAIWELKQGMLKKSGLLQLHRGGERFDTLGGLQGLKAFCLRSMRRQGHANPLKRPKGCLLLSPPGCGKSAIRQVPWKRSQSAHADPRHRLPDGLAGGQHGGEHPPGPEDRRCHVALRGDGGRGRKGPGRCRQFRLHGLRRDSPLVRHVPDLAERQDQRQLRDLHLQRHLEAAAGVQPQRAVRRDLVPGPARPPAEGRHLGHLLEDVRVGAGPAPAQG